MLKGKTVGIWNIILKILAIVWSLACLYVLVYFVASDDPHAGVSFAFSMLYLTSPIGWLAGFIYAYILYMYLDVATLPTLELPYYATTLFGWIIMYVGGFVQWFILVPALCKWFYRWFDRWIRQLHSRLMQNKPADVSSVAHTEVDNDYRQKEL